MPAHLRLVGSPPTATPLRVLDTDFVPLPEELVKVGTTLYRVDRRILTTDPSPVVTIWVVAVGP